MLKEKFEMQSFRLVVNGAELYRLLCIEKNFNSWVVQKIRACNLVEGDDYFRFDSSGNNALIGVKNAIGRPSIIYFLSLDAVIKIILSSEKAGIANRLQMIEECFEMKFQEATKEEIYQIRYREAERTMEKDRTIKALIKLLAELMQEDQ